MMKKQSAAMEKCEAMGAKARAKRMCMAMTKKHAAMKPDAMTGDGMRSDAMKGDHMSSEGHH